jgi:hypothetical protein
MWNISWTIIVHRRWTSKECLKYEYEYEYLSYMLIEEKTILSRKSQRPPLLIIDGFGLTRFSTVVTFALMKRQITLLILSKFVKILKFQTNRYIVEFFWKFKFHHQRFRREHAEKIFARKHHRSWVVEDTFVWSLRNGKEKRKTQWWVWNNAKRWWQMMH